MDKHGGMNYTLRTLPGMGSPIASEREHEWTESIWITREPHG